MKRIRRPCAALILSVTFALPALAGDIPFGVTAPPPPPGDMHAGVTGDMGNGTAGHIEIGVAGNIPNVRRPAAQTNGPARAALLSLLWGLLSLS